uniref:Putative myosin phosphatase dmbs-l n=1 Tax=Anopheles triannulatus TaxID=58253 RepID=A0A2M4AVE3_9DIPT
MSLDNRNTSAQFKRAEQLKRWEESDMAKQASGIPKSPSLRRIQFTPGCIFLAACDAGDKDEVEYLLQDGADIDTANVDGLTALHQVSSPGKGMNDKIQKASQPASSATVKFIDHR